MLYIRIDYFLIVYCKINFNKPRETSLNQNATQECQNTLNKKNTKKMLICSFITIHIQ